MGVLRSAKGRRSALGAGVALALMAFGQLVLLPTAASAATTLTVSTTADIPAGTGDCGSSSTTVPSPLSLREATCIANNYGNTQPVTINIPAGHYTLTSGELAPGNVSGANITMVGAGSASTIIDGGQASRVLNIDAGTIGGVTFALSGVTITNGADSTFGGAGILAGSGTMATSDSLTISNSVISNNVANGATPTSSNKPGGGLSMEGGTLTLTNVTVSGNSSHSSPGSGVYYQAFGTATPQSLSITGSTFSGNATANSGASGLSGGALGLAAGSGLNTVYNVSNSTFVGNTSSSSSTEQAVGAAIFEQTGNLTVTDSTFSSNTVSGSGGLGGPILYTAGTAALHYNRFLGNVGAGGVMTNSGSGVADVAEDWWGCNTGANTAGCETTSGTGITASPRLVLTTTASPSHVVGPNGTATITASLLTDSVGNAVSAANLGAFNALPVVFADPPGDATVTLSAGPHTAAISNGVTNIDYHSNTTLGPDNDTVTLDNASVTATLEVDQAPAITSPNTANFKVGQAGSFVITTTGYPAAAISEAGTLPAGLTFTDNGNGTATLSGTATGGNGSYPLNLTGANGVSPNASQTLTVSIGQPPAFTSPNTATFRIGAFGTFPITTSGAPTVATINESGTLPAGLTFTDNGNGTATIAGTPTGAGNTYPMTLTASNGVSPDATQALSIQVNEGPAVTTNPSNQSVHPGDSVTFTAAATGVPTPTVQWQISADDGATFANLSGATSTSYTHNAPASENGYLYRAVFTNAVASATTTAATLSVGTAPAFSSADTVQFLVGQAGSFSITTSGVPSATLSRTGAQFPAWLTLTDNGDGTGTLTGTPPAGSAGQYQFTLKAANGFSPSASQLFTLFVDASPVISSLDHATFTTGQAGSFPVTATAGYPSTTILTKSGALPSGVTFVDNGDGTATIAGTPAAGTGGSYPITITAATSGGLAPPDTQNFTLTVNQPPVITSPSAATFRVGAAGAVTVTTTAGVPSATTVTEAGALPVGLSFTDNGDGTATLAGTPAVGSGGSYSLSFTASNGIAPDSVQPFVLTVREPTSITSPDHATFQLGHVGSFVVNTSGGFPMPSALSETGTLPPGVTFTDNGDGTATLAGTPAAGGTFPIAVTADNGVAPNATQSFTLTVNSAPSITSPDHTSFAVGVAGSFPLTTTPGTPAATTLTETGALPAGVAFHDNGDGTALLSGTPAIHTGGAYSLTITASNGVLPDSTQSFTLTVTELPTINSPAAKSFVVGTSGSFTVTTTPGFPTTTVVTETGSLPSGVTLHDNSDGTATLAGTPAAGSGGSYPLTLTATNSAGHTDQAFILVVAETSALTSLDHATFTAGTLGTFTVITTGGFPTPPALTETGTLPSGVTFHDNGDGTATLAGTATAGGIYSLTFTAGNGASADASQLFTLTVNGPPSITSDGATTFTQGVAGTFTVTTRAGVPASPPTLTATGAPSGVTFTDNADGTATLAGTSVRAGDFALTITASDGIAPDATQSFTLKVTAAPPVVLSAVLPASAGSLHGVPAHTFVGEVLHVWGDNFAAGAPVTIGVYSTPVVVGRAVADSSGTFRATITVPNRLGSHTFVAAGVARDGDAQYLQTRSVISAPLADSGNGLSNGSGNGGLANTGPDTDPRSTVGLALGLALSGLGLMLIARRRRPDVR